MKVLRGGYIPNSVSVRLPGSIIEDILEKLVSGGKVYLPDRSGFAWEYWPIVGDIRSHCPGHQLWKDIDEWEKKDAEYSRSMLDIARKLRAEFRGPLDFPGSKINDPAMECRLLLDILDWLAGQLLGNVSSYRRYFVTNVIIRGTKVFGPNVSANDLRLYQIAWGRHMLCRGDSGAG